MDETEKAPAYIPAEKDKEKKETIEFYAGSVPVAVAARVYGKDANWVRAGIISGWLPIGLATRKGRVIHHISEWNSKLGRINYYISAKALYEDTGYLWKGERK